MERCSPHMWRTPAVGDAALVCDVCEHRLDLARDITPEVQAEILGDYRRHHGPTRERGLRGGAEGCPGVGAAERSSHCPGLIGGGEPVTCGAS